MKKKNDMTIGKLVGFIVAIMMIVMAINIFNTEKKGDNKWYLGNSRSNSLKIISSSENKDLEHIVQEFAYRKGLDINIEYAGTLDIMQKLNNGEDYDAVWLSNSIWMYMLDSSIVRTSNSKCTSINPVVFGITKSKAEELGFINKTVYTKDILDAITSENLKFSMSNPTSTNSGASAYLGLLSTLAGNPEVLTEEHLKDNELKEKLTSLFSGMERSSGSEEFLEEMFLNGDYEAVVSYESSIININKELEKRGKEPLYAVYPVDGVSIADSPFAFISKDNDDKKDAFIELQSYILSDAGQKMLQERGRRTWYGGITNNVDTSIFNPDWGIDTKTYISPVKYPSTKVIKLALNLYQTELRKPTHVVFCLDYSGSMAGDGYNELMNAMDYILTEKAADDFIQFSEKDTIDVIAFGSSVLGTWRTNDGSNTETLLNQIHGLNPMGTTALYPAAQTALNMLKDEDMEKYNVSVILMTDGWPNVGTYNDLEKTYKNINKQIPIYSIMFGDANEYQMRQIAELSNAKIFDGKKDLVKAFKEVRGYN